MDEFVNKVKQGAIKVKDEAEKFANVAVEKTKVVIDRTKYNYSISNLETKANEVLCQLGEKLYNEYKNGSEFDEDITAKCVLIDGIKKEIEEFKSKIAEAQNCEICSQCGELVANDALYCPKCGAKK